MLLGLLSKRRGDPEWECGQILGRSNTMRPSCSQLLSLLTSYPRDGRGRWTNVDIETNTIISQIHFSVYCNVFA